MSDNRVAFMPEALGGRLTWWRLQHRDPECQVLFNNKCNYAAAVSVEQYLSNAPTSSAAIASAVRPSIW